MKTTRHLLALASLVTAACALPQTAAAASKGAAMRFINGHIYTPQGWRSAMEVRDQKIVRIGTRAQAKRWPRGGAKVVDLKGRTVMPGLYDMHVHPVLQAKGEEGRCRIPQDAGPQRLLELVAACVKAAKPGEWVSGG